VCVCVRIINEDGALWGQNHTLDRKLIATLGCQKRRTFKWESLQPCCLRNNCIEIVDAFKCLNSPMSTMFFEKLTFVKSDGVNSYLDLLSLAIATLRRLHMESMATFSHA